MVTQNDILVPDVTIVGSPTRSYMYSQPQWELKPFCDCCSVTKAVVYCKSDSARLCLPCDDYVHSANSLARSHLRSLICDKCNSGSVITRCLDDKLSLCEDCDDGTCSSHSRQMLRCYTGCPSMDELSKIWASVLGQPNSDIVDWGVLNLKAASSSSPNLNENDMTSAVLQNINGATNIEDELDRLVMNSSNSELHPPTDLHYDPSFVSLVSPPPPTLNCLPKVLPENLGVAQNYSLFQQLDVENVSHFNNGIKTHFPTDHQGKYRFEINGGDMENLLLGQKKSDGSSIKHVEVPSYSDDVVTFPPPFIPTASSSSSSVIGMPSVMSPNWSCNKMVNNLEFPESNMFLPLPNIIGTSETKNVASDQDCSSWSKLLSVEEPWESNLEASSPQARDKAKMRYNEKKKSRTFEKQIRYASRKARADTRKRVKGRFVKAGEAYDYDPAPSTN